MSMKHTLEYWAFRVLRAAGTVLPEGLAVRLGALLGLIAGGVLRIRRREVDEHLVLAFSDSGPAWRRRVALASYAHLGRETVMLFRMGGWPNELIADRVRFEGFDLVREAAEREGGVVLLTGHLGSWEMAGAGVAARGLPLDVVGKGMANRRFERDLFAARERLGMSVIEMSDAPKGVLRSLRRGRVTAMLGDQNAHKHGIFLPFFGKPAATARGPALFAIRTGAPVFVGFAIRDPGWAQRYTVVLQRLEYRITGDHATDVRNLLEQYHRALEDAIRQAPGQYFWQHKRWKTRPPEEQGSSR